MIATAEGRWNHTIAATLAALPPPQEAVVRALDVGCGEGWLCRELARRGVTNVVGLDPDAPSLAEAARSGAPAGPRYVRGDLLRMPFPAASFDLVTCTAALHHVDDQAAALRALAEVVRPGGLLVVVVLARSRSVPDLAHDLAGTVITRVRTLRHGAPWETPAPKTWPPPATYGELEACSAEVLPDRTYRRRALFRAVITWRRPAG